MNELFKNKYRISSARLQTWDYGDNGMYFITICTANREYLFGDVIDSGYTSSSQFDASAQFEASEYKMELNDLGNVVETEWLKTKYLRPDMNLELNEFIVMPNHFHGILFIDDNQYNTVRYDNQEGRDAMHRVSTRFDDGFDIPGNNTKNKFGPQSKNLASVIRGFKSAVTTHARKNNIPFNWQARFHDHIIRSSQEYIKIADYVINNPKNWREDKFYVK